MWLNQSDDFRLSDVMTEDPWSDTRAKSDVPQNLETFSTARAAVLSNRIVGPVEKRQPLWFAYGQSGLADLAASACHLAERNGRADLRIG